MQDFILPHKHHNDEIKNEFLKKHLSETENFQIVSDVFKQLSDTNRLRIFWLLCHSEECVINISSFVNMSPPAVSHHLKQLKFANLIVSERKGKEVHYKAKDSEQTRLLHQTIEKFIGIENTKKDISVFSADKNKD